MRSLTPRFLLKFPSTSVLSCPVSVKKVFTNQLWIKALGWGCCKSLPNWKLVVPPLIATEVAEDLAEVLQAHYVGANRRWRHNEAWQIAWLRQITVAPSYANCPTEDTTPSATYTHGARLLCGACGKLQQQLAVDLMCHQNYIMSSSTMAFVLPLATTLITAAREVFTSGICMALIISLSKKLQFHWKKATFFSS